MMNKSRKSRDSKGGGHIRWVIGTPYFVQGTSAFTEIPILYFIKFTLGMGDAGGQLFDALRQIGWFVKPLWGFISDKIALFGYHRKSWYVLMACLAFIFWLVNALLALFDINIPLIYLLTFNLAFATYAFVDVVCDALMVVHGRKLGQVGSFINFQWAVLATANALSVYMGGWFQRGIEQNVFDPWLVFLLTGIPPLVTAVVGLRSIEEDRQEKTTDRRGKWWRVDAGWLKKWPLRAAGTLEQLNSLRLSFRAFRRDNRPIWILMLFIFFWKFSPSIGYIERSYLIDARNFTPQSFGIILSAGGLTFLASVLAYAWVVAKFPNVGWQHYLYAMIGLGIVTFPLSFYLYLDPEHPWWRPFAADLGNGYNPLPHWNRYQWFRLITQTLLGFASIPAFIIPLTIAGETVNVAYAGVSYAFLMSLSNVTNMFESVIGAGLYKLFSSPSFGWLIRAFEQTPLNIAHTSDERTLILQMFVYIGLFFTLMTIPFLEMLRRELERRSIEIKLGGHFNT